MRNKLRNYKFRLNDYIDLMTSRFLNIQEVDSVCLALGPYRNLTTLTASVLFLHPNCQVLNHAGKRIFGKREIDFLWDYDKKKLDRFIQFAIKISEKGQRGDHGGSITYSHAFDPQHKMKELYSRKYSGRVKEQIKCLFWKESLMTSNLIRKRRVDLAEYIENDDRLRFLLPIRNPLDCAASNLKIGYVGSFQGLDKDASCLGVVQAILNEVFWFADLKERFPHRFFYYFEHDINREMLIRLAKFLQLEPNKEWIINALAAMRIKPGYNHDKEIKHSYRDYVCENGSKFPELSEGLLAFVN